MARVRANVSRTSTSVTSTSSQGARRVVTRANLFGRFVRVAKSYAGAALTKMEDPERVLEQAVADMQEDLIRMRQASAQVVASQRQLEKKEAAARATADEWYRRAELAMDKGDEELAREALKRRKAFQSNADAMGQQLVAQRDASAQLIANTRTLEAKLTEAKSKKDTLKARAASAKTSKQITDMVQGLDTSNAVTAFEKMEEKVMAMESEAEAAGILAAPDGIEGRFAALEGGSSVEDELLMLKSGGAKPGGRRQRCPRVEATRPSTSSSRS